MQLTSPTFKENDLIPSRFTCDGEGVNPELLISAIPSGTESLVLIMSDPDVPKSLRPDGVFDHWLVYDLNPRTSRIPEGSTEGVSGTNTAGRQGYVGPCPPDSEHRYFFTLYALDTPLGFPEGKSKVEIENAMRGHIIETAELVTRYARLKKL